MPDKTMAEFIEDLRKDADAAFPYDVDYMNVVNGIADDLEEVWNREREKTDAKIADLQSRVKLWTDRSAELVKKCNEHYANAHKSECGDRAKLREALSTAIILLMACEWPDDAPMKDIAEVMDEIRKALSAPARQCDVGTAQEQEVRFEAFCHAHRSRERCCEDCPVVADRASCEFTWGQMPYEEGGEK